MTPEQFVAKYSKIQLKETAVSQSHFNDVCALVGHAPPVEYDPEGRTFSFETQTVKPSQLFDQIEFTKVTRKSVTRAEIQELDDIHTALERKSWNDFWRLTWNERKLRRKDSAKDD